MQRKKADCGLVVFVKVAKFSKPLAPISIPEKASLTLNLDSTSIGAAAMLASKKSALAIPGMHADGRKESVGGV